MPRRRFAAKRVRPARFDRRWQGKRRRGKAWRHVVRIGTPFLLLGMLLGTWLFVEDRVRPREEWVKVQTRFELCGAGPNSACVIDGDTVRYGHLRNDRRIRLTGLDAPEMNGACEAERVKAREAKRALHAWLARGPFEWSGGDDPPRDKYGRELREARRGDELLADHMIALGLAEGGGWLTERIDWCG